MNRPWLTAVAMKWWETCAKVGKRERLVFIIIASHSSHRLFETDGTLDMITRANGRSLVRGTRIEAMHWRYPRNTTISLTLMIKLMLSLLFRLARPV